jgi:tellurite methyltransferase
MEEPILTAYHKLLPPGGAVLDIGAGQGRNALFLARKGIEVEAVEPSYTAIESLKEITEREKLPIRTFQCTFREFSPNRDAYSAFLLFGLLPMLGWEDIRKLLHALDTWGSSSNLVFVTAFTTLDPAFDKMSRSSTPIGRNSFQDRYNQVWTFLEPGEISALFPGYRVVHHWEGEGEEHRHGNGPMHKHGMIESVLRRAE